MTRRMRRWRYWLGPNFDRRQLRRVRAGMGKGGDAMDRWICSCVVARAKGHPHIHRLEAQLDHH